ncbi:MAG: murein biosynthesis integral membrane protein MurJ [Caloramator sp.]|nr:murein biosynthesis integral membrane protein MurJ [Caloramator sp.]
MTKNKGENIQKATVIVMLALFLSRILGFVREMIVAKVYGRNYITDSFIAAFTIPDVMFYLLVGGALSSGFMPVFNSYIAKDDEEGAWESANTFITVAIIFILIFNVLGITFAKYLVPVVASGLAQNKDALILTTKLTRIMFSAVTFTVFAGLTRGVLNSYKIFTSPSIGPVLYNIGMILGALLLGKKLGIYGISIGVVVGAIMNFAVQVPDFKRVGKRFKLELNTQNEGYKRMLHLMVPAIIGLSISQVNLVVNQNIASVLDEGSITALRYANRIMLLPLGIFAMGIATTIFPVLNTQVARGEFSEFKDTLSLGFRTVMFITIPSTVGMIVLNTPIVRFLFRTGRFTESDVRVTAFALAFYSFAVVGQSAVQIITRGFYSIQDTKTPVKIGALTVLINIVLNLIFVRSSTLAIGGIALSYSITSIINMILLYKKLSEKVHGLRINEDLKSSIKSSIASFIMGGAAFIISRVIESKLGIDSKMVQIIDVGVSVTVAIIIYFAAAYVLKMPEMDYVIGILKKKIKK